MLNALSIGLDMVRNLEESGVVCIIHWHEVANKAGAVTGPRGIMVKGAGQRRTSLDNTVCNEVMNVAVAVNLLVGKAAHTRGDPKAAIAPGGGKKGTTPLFVLAGT